jgi:hypothetical protein
MNISIHPYHAVRVLPLSTVAYSEKDCIIASLAAYKGTHRYVPTLPQPHT